MLGRFLTDHLTDFPFSVNGDSPSSAPTDNASSTGTAIVSGEPTLSSNCTSTPVEDPPVQETLTSSENNECIVSNSAAFGSEAQNTSDPSISNSASSSAFEAAKLRQPDGCMEPARQQSGSTNTETLPSGYVIFFFKHVWLTFNSNFLITT